MVDRPLRKKQSELRLDEPMDRGPGLRLQYDPERVGRFSERVARFLGTWRFIIWMTLFIAVWIALNVVIVLTRSPDSAPDPYPFIFLTLLLSLQASYAAPLILLAQNRQDDRDRVQWTEDRVREVAALRMALGESATRDYVRGEIRSALDEIRELVAEENTSDETEE